VFLILLRYVRPIEEVDALRPAHLEFLGKGFDEGRYVMAGRRVPPEGGVVIARGTDEAAVAELTEQDPYVVNGVAEYELVRFHVGLTEEGLAGDDPL
jgi:uncharacterized protein YciI